MTVGNIFSNIPKQIPDELFQTLAETTHCKIERIVSKSHSSPDTYWYDQEKNEWVMILKGSAGLLFEGSDEIVVMNAGDYVNIPAHSKHRVQWTDPKEETVWLAIHYS